MRTIIFTLTLCLACSGSVLTQSRTGPIDELALRIKPGDTIQVRDAVAREIEGVFVSLAGGKLKLTVAGELQELATVDVREVVKRGDSPWNGALIGAGIAGGLILAAPVQRDVSAGRRTAYAAAAALSYGVIGSLIDRAITGRTVVFRSEMHRSAWPLPSVPASNDVEWFAAKPGDAIHVSEWTGNETTATFVSLADGHLTLKVADQLRAIPWPTVRLVTKPGDSPWNGALIGAAVGTGFGALVEWDSCRELPDGRLKDPEYCERSMGKAVLNGAFGSAAIGLLIDYLVKGRTVVFRAAPRTSVRLTPVVLPQQQSLRLSITFN